MARKLKRDLTMEEQLARGPVDLPFLMLVLMLTGIGVVMVFSGLFRPRPFMMPRWPRTTLHTILCDSSFLQWQGVAVM